MHLRWVHIKNFRPNVAIDRGETKGNSRITSRVEFMKEDACV